MSPSQNGIPRLVSTVKDISLTDGAVLISTRVFYLVAVKFGRMSKKQREKVEDEANFHKRNRLNGFDGPYNGAATPNNNTYPR